MRFKTVCFCFWDHMTCPSFLFIHVNLNLNQHQGSFGAGIVIPLWPSECRLGFNIQRIDLWAYKFGSPHSLKKQKCFFL